ncbi:MAG TPA: hypothetical protein PKM88_12265 [bacterium]|nr:hypothetical protein [bacterium]
MDRLARMFDSMRETTTVALLGRARDRLRAAQLLVEHRHFFDATDRAAAGTRLISRALLTLLGTTGALRDSELETLLAERRDERAAALLALLAELNALGTALDSGSDVDVAADEARRLLRQAAELLAAIQKFYREIKQAHAAREEAKQASKSESGPRAVTVCYQPNPAAAHQLPLTPFVPGGQGTGRKPWYDSILHCVMCDGYEFLSTQPRLKAQQLVYRYANPLFPLLVEETEGAGKGVDPIDPSAGLVHVCPNCLYASGNPGNFYSDARYGSGGGLLQSVNSRRLAKFRELMLAQLEQRAAIYERRLDAYTPAAVFAQPRSQQAALAALELASFACEAEFEVNGNALFYAGKHQLAAAKIAAAISPDEERPFLERALDCFTRGFERCSQTAELLYLTAVLHAQFGNVLEARTRLARLLTDRGDIPAAVRYKGWCANLNELLRQQK